MKRLPILLALMTLPLGNLAAQIPNAGFEDTLTTLGVTRPQQWNMSSFGSGVSNQAYSGNFAMEIWTWYCYAKGFAVAGDNPHGTIPMNGMPFDHPGGIPITGRPIRLRGFYRYNMGAVTGPDSATVQITMKKFNATTQQADVVGFSEVHLPPAGSYEPFQVDIQYTSTDDPDSMVIGFVSSMTAQCDGMVSCDCFYLNVDELALDFNAGTVSLQDLMHTTQAFPNPASGQVTIRHAGTGATQILLRDVQGRDIRRITQPGIDQTTLDISSWSPGIYMYTLWDADGLLKGQGKIIRQ